MPNTVIQIKKSATPSSVPADLANGELAINFADGKLYYKGSDGVIKSISGGGGGGNNFGIINANGTLVLSDTTGDTVTMLPGDFITITGDAINDTITIGANLKAVYDTTNAAYNTANTTSNTANLAIYATLGYTIDGGGSVITTGVAGPGIRVPFKCNVESVSLLSRSTGNIEIDIWKTEYINYPPTSANSITGTPKPTINNSRTYEDTTLTGWNKSINVGDVLLFNVNACSNVFSCGVFLRVSKRN